MNVSSRALNTFLNFLERSEYDLSMRSTDRFHRNPVFQLTFHTVKVFTVKEASFPAVSTTLLLFANVKENILPCTFSK